MVKFGKNKLKALNKIAKKQNTTPNNVAASNKILKKKQNAEKKVSFQKEVLLKETLAKGSSLVKNVSAQEILLNELSKKPAKRKEKRKVQEEVQKPKFKSVERKKKRQQALNSDTRLLLKLMSKK